MKSCVVDASVWVSAQDATDPFCKQSRAFLSHAIAMGTALHVPALAKLEIACALARKLRDPGQGERLAASILNAAHAKEQAVNTTLLAKSLAIGTTKCLRGADAVYAATAEHLRCTLVSWDKEHLDRAGAWKPNDWLDANP